MAEQVAIARGVRFGCRDVGRPVLWFETYIDEGIGALQVIEGDEALRIVQATGVYDIKELDGRACQVTVDRNTIKFVRFWKGPHA